MRNVARKFQAKRGRFEATADLNKNIANKPGTLYGTDRGWEKTAANYGLFGARPCPRDLAQKIAIDCKSTLGK
jgi:hypothetical protein